MAFECRWANRTLGAREGAAGADLYFPQPRDEDDVRVEVQWQEHVCRSNLVSGVPARVEGRGAAESLPWRLGQPGLFGPLGGVRGVPQLLFHTNAHKTTKTPSALWSSMPRGHSMDLIPRACLQTPTILLKITWHASPEHPGPRILPGPDSS